MTSFPIVRALSALIPLVLCARVAAFQVVENFESYSPGPLTTASGGAWQAYPAISQPMVAEDPGGKYVSFGRSTSGGPFVSMHRPLSPTWQIPATGLSTFYFRVRPRGARMDHSIGLADGLSGEPTFGDFHPQVGFLDASTNGTTNFRVGARSGGSYFDVLASAPKGEWYDFWIVTDRDRGTYDVWYSADGGHPVLLANDYTFRTPSTAPFTTILSVCNGQNSNDLSVDYDDFHVRPGRLDLSRPSRPGIQPAPLRVTTFNTKSGTASNLTTFRDNYLNGDHVICLQEVKQSDWSAIQAVFPNHPYRMLTVKNATALFSFKTECIAILSSLPILESDAKIIQIDPQGDKWQRWAQYVRVDLGGGRSVPVFHYHNTYNFDENNFASEKSGMQKFHDWILLKTGAASLAAVPDLVVLGDFNLTSSADVLTIMAMPLVRANGRDYLMANAASKASTTLWTANVLSDHNGLAASLDLPILHDRYEKWALAAFNDAELRAGLGAKSANPDGDSLDNFAEYALNLHPWRMQGSAVTVTERAFHFRRGSGRGDAGFALESADDLTGWAPIAFAENGGAMLPLAGAEVMETTTEGGESTISTVEAIDGQPRRFIRQRTTQAP